MTEKLRDIGNRGGNIRVFLSVRIQPDVHRIFDFSQQAKAEQGFRGSSTSNIS
jgi:hypothetical protein